MIFMTSIHMFMPICSSRHFLIAIHWVPQGQGKPPKVALGTSLPDTFASKAAAEQEKHPIFNRRRWVVSFVLVDVCLGGEASNI